MAFQTLKYQICIGAGLPLRKQHPDEVPSFCLVQFLYPTKAQSVWRLKIKQNKREYLFALRVALTQQAQFPQISACCLLYISQNEQTSTSILFA